VPIEVIAGGTLLISVAVAVDCPLEFEAVIVSFPDAGIEAGAVYKPVDDTVPATAVQVVAPAAVNCWVPPSTITGLFGEITGALTVPPPPPPPELVPETGIVRLFPATDPGF